jgi:hypothetical protein
MPSPFPGMDPYLEPPNIWEDFHANLAGEIQAQLTPDRRHREHRHSHRGGQGRTPSATDSPPVHRGPLNDSHRGPHQALRVHSRRR